MRIANLRRTPKTVDAGVSGVARVDRRTRNLTQRVRAGEIAVIDQVDLDQANAEALVARRVAAVVNAAQFTSGRYPNLGPQILADAGIVLLDNVGEDVLGAVKDGQRVLVVDDVLSIKGEIVARGQALDRQRVGELREDARQGMSTQLESFTANAMEYLQLEREMLLEGVGLPQTATRLRGRHVLVVVDGHGVKSELRGLRGYIAEHGPVLVGVEAGADALRAAGHEPALVIGDLDTVSDASLRRGAELVVHTSHAGRPAGMDRLERFGIDGTVCRTALTAEDVALLLAHHNDAALTVTAGTSTTLVEFLDRGRSSMASTFLTRLETGPGLVEATTVASLYRSRVRSWHLLILLLSSIVALLAVIALTPLGQEWIGDLGAYTDEVVDWAEGLFS